MSSGRAAGGEGVRPGGSDREDLWAVGHDRLGSDDIGGGAFRLRRRAAVGEVVQLGGGRGWGPSMRWCWGRASG
jgi:hypothetical protein